ncbi:hypothetical protein PAXINDRAFT_14036 [Paxillus involutus ATCC 200175]|uniref:DUF6534 domain-containing protein n=1 Tax=Paxillus involutus ATCC 200175 TaxID=664439 RepID=A0A0C9TC51_PAXIN|nr:hypothetical protein PAXINDRAFT_14036 [Paxillus involutus ATCC 200175]
MTTYPFALIWGPMVVGFTVAAASYGATIGQLIYYVQGFPRDKRFVKILVASATAQVVLGLMVVADAIRIPTMEALTSSRYTPWAAIASATCDAMITSSVFYHLRPARTGVTRRGNVIKRINDVFIQMGLLSFINSMAMVILYYIQDHQLGEFMTAAPGLMLSKTYVNSMLAVYMDSSLSIFVSLT